MKIKLISTLINDDIEKYDYDTILDDGVEIECYRQENNAYAALLYFDADGKELARVLVFDPARKLDENVNSDKILFLKFINAVATHIVMTYPRPLESRSANLAYQHLVDFLGDYADPYKLEYFSRLCTTLTAYGPDYDKSKYRIQKKLNQKISDIQKK